MRAYKPLVFIEVYIGVVGVEYTFVSRISKHGDRYYIKIPKAVDPSILKHHGRRVLVHVKVLEEGKA